MPKIITVIDILSTTKKYYVHNRKEWAVIVQDIMDSRGLGRSKFAQWIGISTSKLDMILHGRQYPCVKMLSMLAQNGYNINELLRIKKPRV